MKFAPNIRLQLLGDQAKAEKLIGIGKSLVPVLQNLSSFQNLKQNSFTKHFGENVVMTASHVFEQVSLDIWVRPVVVPYVAVVAPVAAVTPETPEGINMGCIMAGDSGLIEIYKGYKIPIVNPWVPAGSGVAISDPTQGKWRILLYIDGNDVVNDPKVVVASGGFEWFDSNQDGTKFVDLPDFYDSGLGLPWQTITVSEGETTQGSSVSLGSPNEPWGLGKQWHFLLNPGADQEDFLSGDILQDGSFENLPSSVTIPGSGGTTPWRLAVYGMGGYELLQIGVRRDGDWVWDWTGSGMSIWDPTYWPFGDYYQMG